MVMDHASDDEFDTTLRPPTTVSAGEDLTRADYQRWMVEDSKHEVAKEIRAEREKRRRELAEHRREMQQIGKEIAAAQRNQRGVVAASREHLRQQVAEIGAESRIIQQTHRQQRDALRDRWTEYGKVLVHQFGNDSAKQSKAELYACKAANVKEVKDHLYKLNSAPGVSKQDRIAANRLHAEKIRSETDADVTRMARKHFIDIRWDNADSMRGTLDNWRQERTEAKQAYIKRAKDINRATSSTNEAARRAREKVIEERQAQAQEMRRARETVLSSNRDRRVADAIARQALHAQVHSSKFVALADTKATPERLKPYFSFRTPARRRKPHEVRI
ncbi:hypothetical protein AB1Y20_007265 [Prymnesium parvum]|uniref:Uncharacterized protein n=1 Tax=Prymnesium parvum TaxID=97485 RepID=A0AB34IXF4_PRYPA|mmetsp:Transcript_15363/g.36880  ORF Transcript_15363/g.36880 Transcript_15363/m.36880 type:complete len:332 (-) Transcript_15363:182-1177(-)|eukprot:CAMPEP_0182811698 /NCGR_PEP_ID=MMETSP0006_2-20121128/8410_1 /TAXON_ID=97485 /ORGANISM="Prymnesium parvum, Strain Texoma1" /LENGTH=331 /DNA_ID=CAMNT_0024937675 /DNA_START=65 /DNA_END=1060 /DNA_ORIENTATION=-